MVGSEPSTTRRQALRGMSSPTVLGNGRRVPLSVITDNILYDKNPFDFGLADVSTVAGQILFANHVDIFYELILAVASFDACLMKANPKRRPVGLNILRLGNTAQCFFESHPDYKRPPDETVPLDPQSVWELDHFRKYLCGGRSEEFCQRWLEYVFERHPRVKFDATDPHQWRETDDPIVISYCSHRLLVPSEVGLKPEKTAYQEALQAALKLYSQPHRYGEKWTTEPRQFIHFDLIDRQAALSLAIEVGDLEAAADILEFASSLEGITQGGQAHKYLQVPGIFKVLPIFASRRSENNSYSIKENDAKNIVAGVKAAMESRITKGQQVFLDGVSWTELFDRLKVAAWKIYNKSYRKQGLTSEDDILFPPATEEEIAAAEERVGTLPDDFKEMIRVANGYEAPLFRVQNMLINVFSGSEEAGTFLQVEWQVYKTYQLQIPMQTLQTMAWQVGSENVAIMQVAASSGFNPVVSVMNISTISYHHSYGKRVPSAGMRYLDSIYILSRFIGTSQVRCETR